MNPVEIRLLSQGLAAPRETRPEGVVEHFGAMQAQEYRLMRWGVAMRTKKPSLKAFKEAFDDGRIVRRHLLRGTWQLVTGEDYWWMQDLCASKAERVISGWMSANHITIPEEEASRVLEIIVQTTHRLRSATKEDYDEALRANGIVMDDHRLSYHIRFGELRGVLCSGDLLPMKATYSLVSEKLGANPNGFFGLENRDEALKLLARKYFRSHSPATFEDWVWWSGMNVSDCRKGISLLGDELRLETWQGREFYLHESCRTRGVRRGGALLLPPYDEYLIGYKSRDVVLPPAHAARAHNNSGNFYPVVAHDGIICGNWSPFAKDLSINYFQQDYSPLNEPEAWQRYLRARN